MRFHGELSEWPKEHDWKSCIRRKRILGSNPRLSARLFRGVLRGAASPLRRGGRVVECGGLENRLPLGVTRVRIPPPPPDNRESLSDGALFVSGGGAGDSNRAHRNPRGLRPPPVPRPPPPEPCPSGGGIRTARSPPALRLGSEARVSPQEHGNSSPPPAMGAPAARWGAGDQNHPQTHTFENVPSWHNSLRRERLYGSITFGNVIVA